MPCRVCVIFDDRDRPETTGGYCLRALQELTDVKFARPDQLGGMNPSAFDLFFRIDDGLDYLLPRSLRPLAWWAIDTHLDFDRCLAQALTADLTFAAQRPGAEALRGGGVAAVEWLPLACDPQIHRPHELAKQWDFTFIGNVFPGARTELVEQLRRRFPNHFVGQAYFEEMARRYSESRTVFNRSIRNDLNMRVFEALACRSLLVTNRLPQTAGQDELFRDGVHLATYDTPEELLDKVRFYLARPEARSIVERAGCEEVMKRHTYRHRMERVLKAREELSRVFSAIPSPDTITKERPAATAPTFDPGYFEYDRPELLALVPQSARDVVDVGCGAGRLGEALKARQACRVVGVEQNPVAAAAARTRLDLVVEGDAERIDWPFAEHSFDVIVCGDVLEHLREPLAFLRQVRTWLRHSGILVTSLPNVRHHSVICGLLSGDWTYEPAGLLDHTHLRFFTRREIEKLLFRAGFQAPTLQAVPGPGYRAWVEAGRRGEVSVGGLRIGPLEPAEAEEFYTYQWLAAATPAETLDRGLTSIVILTHNQLAITRGCVDSIRLLTDEPYELVFVDNGSSDGTPEYLKSLAASDPRVKVVLNTDNRGFPAGCNEGIQASTGRQVLLLNNDTVVTTGWLSRLLRALHSDATVGLAGPCSNRVSGEQQVPVSYADDLAGLDGFAWEWGKSHDRQTESTDRLVGFCLLIKRDVIDAVGLLDERFGVGNFEDDDYCLRANRAGFRAVIARDAFIHHIGGATFANVGVDYGKLLDQNAARFRAKWGGDLQARPDSDSPADTSSPVLRRPSRAPAPSFTLRAAEGGGLLLERSQVGVSACLIVRDNANTIRPCLESLRPWVDELVVVDTGSKDNTSAIAAELGARVFSFPWCDDFSAARNESVRHARGEWVFWMDSDDTIDETNGRGLRDLVRRPHADGVLGYVIRVHCPGPGPTGSDDMTVVDHVKLFRNRTDLRFEHRIHEQILPAIRRAGGEVAWTDLFVVHSGYDHSPDGQVRKKERDLRILHKELDERPDHPFTLFNLGMTYADIGEPARASQYLEDSLRTSLVGESHRRKAYALLAHTRLQLNDRNGALATCDAGLAECPEDLELQFRRGVVLHELGRLAESAAVYEHILAAGGERYFTSVDRGVGGFKARQNLAAVCADLGDWNRAELAWRAVTDEVPSYRPGWRGLGEVLVRGNKLDEAAGLSTRLVADSLLACEGYILEGRVAVERNQYDKARRAWERAAKADPNDPEPLQLLGRLHFETGDDEPAAQVLKALTELSPRDPAAHHNLGSVLLRTGRAAESIKALERSLELRPDSSDTRVILGHALRAAGNRTGAVAAWQAVLASEPFHREAADALKGLAPG